MDEDTRNRAEESSNVERDQPAEVPRMITQLPPFKRANQDHLTSMTSNSQVKIKIAIQGSKLIDVEVPCSLTRRKFEAIVMVHLGVECDCDWINREGPQLWNGEIIIISEEGKLKERFKTGVR
jgi:hypothetical protein